MAVDANAVISGITKIAALPDVAVKFNDAIQNPLTSNQDLENIISEDSALASRVLRISNSAIYSFPSKIDTISKALNIIGQNEVRDIIFACSIINSFKNVPETSLNMEQFWRHNLAVAVASRLIASLRRENNVERYFLAGLLHDLGRLILLVERPGIMGKVFASFEASGGYLYAEEKKEMGFCHSDIAALLLKKWRFPKAIIESVRYHHNPSSAGEYIIPAGIVHIADIIAHAVKLGESGERNVPILDEKAWGFVAVDIDDIDYIFDQLCIQYEEAVKYILGE